MTGTSMLRVVMFVGFALAASTLTAATLSVVPLAKALQNPVLTDTKSTEFEAAFKQVTDLLLNQPVDEDEKLAMRDRVAALSAHRDSRVGKLFFAALAAVPEIENLGDAEFAAIEAGWPLSFGGRLNLRVEYTRHGETWLISALEATADGVAAAPIAGMAPYFGIGAPRPELLNLEAIDYLVGRDPADREKIEAERPAFDFDAALSPIFKAEAGAFKALLEKLQESIKSSVDREKRIAAVKEHLATEADVKAMQDADADPERREAFWTGMREQVASALESPRPAALPSANGSQVKVRYRMAGKKDESEQSAQRLATGKVALGGVR
jgi:hypothetical protein